jgi:hypothetical protein
MFFGLARVPNILWRTVPFHYLDSTEAPPALLQVIKLAEEFKAKIEVIASEDDVKPLEVLISEAYTEIDKAVNRNILHKNNGARKKARIARYKREVLVQAGLYTALPGQPGFKAPKTTPLRASA